MDSPIRTITREDSVMAAVRGKAAEETERAENLVIRCAYVIRDLELNGPPPNAQRSPLPNGRINYLYQIAGVRFKFTDNGRNIHITEVRFSR